MLVYLLVLICSSCGPPVAPPHQPQTETLAETATSQFIMEKVFENISRNTALRNVLLSYQKRLVTEDLRHVPPRISKFELFQVFGRSGKTIQSLIEENGKVLKSPKEKPSRIDLDTALNGRYKYTLAPQPLLKDAVTGRLCYILEFSPIDFPPGARSGEDGDTVAVLNRIKGTIVIDSEFWYIARLEGILPKPFTHKVIATIAEFTVLVEQQIVSAPGDIKIFVPSLIRTTLHYWRPFSEVYQRETATYDNIRFINSPQ